MQLHFSLDERNLLADIFLNQGDPAGLLDRIMAGDLRFDLDELDDLRDVLVANQRGMQVEASECRDLSLQETLQARLALLESLIERVSEACAML